METQALVDHRFQPTTARGEVSVTVDSNRLTYVSAFETANVLLADITLVEMRINPSGAVGRRAWFHLVVHSSAHGPLKITNDPTRGDESLSAVDVRFFTFVGALARGIVRGGHAARFQSGNPPFYYFMLAFTALFALATVLFGTLGIVALGVKMAAGALFAAGMTGWCLYKALSHKPKPAKAEEFFFDDAARG